LLAEREHVVGRGVRQRPPQDSVDDTEDGGVGADAEREREQCHGGESWLAAQHARAEGDVLPKSVPHTAEPSQFVADWRKRPPVRGPFPSEGEHQPQRLPPEPSACPRGSAAIAHREILLVKVARDRLSKIARDEPGEQPQDERNLLAHV
jgi:hypothetical protein